MLEFGVNFLPDHPLETAEWIKYAEEHGFQYAWLVDSQILWSEVYSCLTCAALETKSIKLGPGVTNPHTRHPVVTASSIATLNLASRGRAVLGIGRGDSSVRTMGEKPVSLKEFREALTLIKKLASGEEATYLGQPIKLRWAEGAVKIYVAAYGPKVLELAGQVADGVILQIGSPGVVRWSLEHVRRGAVAAGRRLEDLEVVAMPAAYISEDVKQARDAVRYYPPVVANHVFDLLKVYKPSELPRELVRNIEVFKDKYHYEEHFSREARHAAFTTDEMVDELTLAGGVAHCVERAEELRRAGATQLCVYLLRDYLKEQIKLFSEKVMPGFHPK